VINLNFAGNFGLDEDDAVNVTLSGDASQIQPNQSPVGRSVLGLLV